MTQMMTESEAYEMLDRGEVEKIADGYNEMCVFDGERVAMPGRSMQLTFEIDDWRMLMREARNLPHDWEKTFELYGEKVAIRRGGEDERDNYELQHVTGNYSADNPPKTYFTENTIERSLEFFRL